MLRVQLNNATFGPLVIRTDDPIGINDLEITVKRSEQYEGIIYEVVLNLEFIKAARRYLLNCFELAGGIDADVDFLLYDLNDNNHRWDLIFTGKVNFTGTEITEDRIKVLVEQTGMSRRVLNLMERSIDLETELSEDGTALPAQTVITPVYHSKKIKRLSIRQSNENEAVDVRGSIDPGTLFAMYGMGKFTSDEVLETFDFPTGMFEADPTLDLKYYYKFKEGGVCTINNLHASYRWSNSGIPRDYSTTWWLKHGPAGNLTTVELGTASEDDVNVFEGFFDLDDYTFNVNVGDVLFIYGTITFSGPNVAMTQASDDPFSLDLEVATLVPATQCKTIMFHEAMERTIQYYTNSSAPFYSTLLGRTDLGYDEDGELSLIGFTNGHNLRGRDKAILFSFEELRAFANAIMPVGFGFETIDGVEKLVFEKLEYFWNKNLEVLDLGTVYNIRKRVNDKLFYNQFEFGYSSKLDAQQVNGVDEFNTLRRYSLPIVNTKNKLSVATPIHASGYEIESQRRLTGSTEDGRLDDENFAVAMVRDGGDFVPATNEGITDTANIYSPETAYNLSIMPSRILRNWKQVLASNLVRSTSKTLRFIYGEQNYQAATKRATDTGLVYENGDYTITANPIWDNIDYLADDIKMTKEEFIQVLANPKGYFTFKDLAGNTMEGFIESGSGLTYKPNEKLASFEYRKVARP